MIGRPCSFTQEVGDKISARLAAGESLRAICRDDGYPDAATVFRWLAGSDEALVPFREQYTRAREIQADALVDEILEIADDGTNDYMTRKGAEEGQGVEVVNHDHIQRSRLRVDTRKWFASKVMPKKYGERMQLANDPTDPITPVINVTVSKG